MATLLPTALYWQPALGSDEVVTGLSDIDQSIRTILTTRRGTVPHRPEFGSYLHKYLDWPQNRVTPYLVRETRAAINHPTEGEPRADIVQIVVTHTLAATQLLVRWKIKGDDDVQSTLLEFSK